MLCAIGILTALAGWLAAQVEPSWTVRYLAVVVAPLLLAAAGALAPSRPGRLVVAATCVLLAGWSAVGSLLPNPNAAYAKSNVAAIARAVAPQLAPGDVVVTTQTEQLAVLAHYLPKGLVYVTPTGPVSDPYVVDWRNIISRLRRPSPAPRSPRASTPCPSAPTCSRSTRSASWEPAVRPGTGPSMARSPQIDRLIATDPSLRAVGSYQEGLKPRPYSPVIGELFQRIPGANPCR